MAQEYEKVLLAGTQEQYDTLAKKMKISYISVPILVNCIKVK